MLVNCIYLSSLECKEFVWLVHHSIPRPEHCAWNPVGTHYIVAE